LPRTEAARLLAMLRQAARSKRRWFYLVSSRPSPSRLRLADFDRTPAYERKAARNYVRREVYRITGQEDSCNIEFSSNGAILLARELRGALARAREFLDLRVPHRKDGKRDELIEFIPDTDREAMPSEEIARLGMAGENLAGAVLEAEDFSDWERAGV